MPVLAALGIAIGYTVVLGWFLKYLFAAATGTLLAQPDMGAYFGQITGDFGSIGWHAAALIITLAVMVLGISRGIERLNKIMMPLFFVLFCVLLVRVAMLPGALDGYAYLFFMPRWEALANPQTWVLALGQAFFGLSLAGGGTLVYGSYLKKDVNVVSSARNVVVFSTLAAVLSAMVVVPAVFAFEPTPRQAPASVHRASTGIRRDALRRTVLLRVLPGRSLRRHHQLGEPLRTADRGAAAAGAPSRWAAVTIVAAVSMGVGAFIENGDAVSAWMDAVSIYAIPLGALYSGRDVLLGVPTRVSPQNRLRWDERSP